MKQANRTGSTMPRWRIGAIGIWSSVDEQNERAILGFALQCERIPRSVHPEHFLPRWHQRIFCAALTCGAWCGKATLTEVARLLRWANLASRGELLDLASMYQEAQFITEPLWDSFVARAELRVRVVDTELVAHRLRAELRV